MAFLVCYPRAAVICIGTSIATVAFYFGTSLQPVWPLVWLAPAAVLFMALRLSAIATACVGFVAYTLGSLNTWSYEANVLEFPRIIVISGLVVPALMFTLSALFFRALVRSGAPWLATLAFPAAFVSFEFIRSVTSVNGTFGALAYTQTDFLPLLQLSSITGIWGIDFVIMLTAAAVAIITSPSAIQETWKIGAAVAVIILVVVGYGAIRLGKPSSDRHLVAATLASDQHLEFPAYKEEIGRLVQDGVEAVVLPENQLRATAHNVKDVMAQLSSLARQNNVLLVCGLHRLDPSNNRNEAVVFSPQGQLLGTYIKHHLFPGTNDIPGNEIVVFTQLDAQSGVEICKDMDFPTLSRQYGQRGIGMMFVPASDYDVDGRMHSRMALMRAVESGFALIRAARHGLLTVSDDRGHIIAERRSNSAPLASVVAAVGIEQGDTIYRHIGDWTAYIAFVLVFIGAAKLMAQPFVKRV